MTNALFHTVEAGPGREIRFEIERRPAGKSSRPSARVTLRLWTRLTGVGQAVATGRSLTIDGDRFGAFLDAAQKTGQALGDPSLLHE